MEPEEKKPEETDAYASKYIILDQEGNEFDIPF